MASYLSNHCKLYCNTPMSSQSTSKPHSGLLHEFLKRSRCHSIVLSGCSALHLMLCRSFMPQVGYRNHFVPFHLTIISLDVAFAALHTPAIHFIIGQLLVFYTCAETRQCNSKQPHQCKLYNRNAKGLTHVRDSGNPAYRCDLVQWQI